MYLKVMLVERAIDGTGSNPRDALYQTSNDVKVIHKFLKDHRTAKIVVVINTHCEDNGYFVWTGSSDETYRSCSLLEVR